MNDRFREFVTLLFVAGVLAFSYPLLSLFDQPVLLFGIPLLYLYIFLVWLGVIGLLAVIMERYHHNDGEAD